MSLKHSYTLVAPFYDAAVSRATLAARKRSLSVLPVAPSRVLLAGVGTGLDLPHLPAQHHYVGVDLTHAMLRRAVPRSGQVNFTPVQGDAQNLPFASGIFDVAVLHLILAVVPDPARCLGEIARVLRPGGQALVFDKFLRHGQPAVLRRLANPLLSRIATRLDVVFESVLAAAPGLRVEHDQPALAGGWFRMIRLRRV
ncbi:MAG: methyltransferase domain-containing protein [Dechloromonas sp.]|nr:methyltransferase domain-containing protein [Candidatus Dechloromonas phosphoritropha]MBL0355320.1 methyltransferase domain-containing protein [Candidatus Dechloromonas phosphoritropha]MBP8788433.1 methyltransferase domain-containing protein [Azonexus sp.]MBP9228867.1 methyltransferase domain-containing protein [Azonexus sp.]